MIVGILVFAKVLVQCERQTTVSRIWTHVTMFISFDNIHYTRCMYMWELCVFESHSKKKKSWEEKKREWRRGVFQSLFGFHLRMIKVPMFYLYLFLLSIVKCKIRMLLRPSSLQQKKKSENADFVLQKKNNFLEARLNVKRNTHSICKTKKHNDNLIVD